MSSAKARFPPGGVANWEKGYIQLTALVCQMLMDNSVCILCQSGVAGEEDRVPLSAEQIHVGRGTPAVDCIAASIVLGRRSVDRQGAYRNAFFRSERLRMGVATTSEPSGNRRRAEQRNITGKCIETREGQMIRMRVRQKKCIDWRKVRD
jgi:hypothetical protein